MMVRTKTPSMITRTAAARRVWRGACHHHTNSTRKPLMDDSARCRKAGTLSDDSPHRAVNSVHLPRHVALRRANANATACRPKP